MSFSARISRSWRSITKPRLPQAPGGHRCGSTHNGYFSIDKKTNRLRDPAVGRRRSVESDDVDAYDLILKDKERLLSFAEPTRFIFSHSALREGWDNPNVFVMCMLKHSDNTVSRRQEVGRGLRLSVDQNGDRMDNPAVVHDINVLTVVTDESYTDFVGGPAARDQRVPGGPSAQRRERLLRRQACQDRRITARASRRARSITPLYNYTVRPERYIDDDGLVTDAYKAARKPARCGHAESGEPFDILGDARLAARRSTSVQAYPAPPTDRKPKRIPLNEENFEKQEFQELWRRINHKVRLPGRVRLRGADRRSASPPSIAQLNVTAMQYMVQSGEQRATLDTDDLVRGRRLRISSTRTEAAASRRIPSAVRPLRRGHREDSAHKANGGRNSRWRSRRARSPKYRQNPEHFITEAARLINEQKATMIVEHLAYDTLRRAYDSAIFTENQTKQDFTKAGDKLKKHIYDYVITDSQGERNFVTSWTPATRSSSTPSCPAASSSRPRSATTTPTGPSPSRRGPSSTSTSSLRPRGRCRSMQLRGSRGRQSRMRPQALR